MSAPTTASSSAPPITTVEHVCALFAQPSRPRPILLIGAGASRKSGIPLSGEIVERAARWGYCKSRGLAFDDPLAGRRTDWLRWLQEQPWYERGKRHEDNYSLVLRHVLNPLQDRKDFFVRILNPGVPASSGYEHLLDLLAAEQLTTVLTPNFDSVLPELKIGRKRPHHLQVIRTEADYGTFSTSPSSPQLVYLHGSVEHYTDRNLNEEVQRLDEKLVSLLVPLLRDHPLVVVGYRGAEPSVMKHLLIDQTVRTNGFRQGIYWCVLTTEAIHPLVLDLAKAVAPNFHLVPIAGFDELMAEVEQSCSKSVSTPHRPVLNSTVPDNKSLPFEMRIISDANLEDDFDWTRVQKELMAYCRRMDIAVPTTITRNWMLDQLCALDLVSRIDGTVAPTVAGYLLFAHKPAKRFKGAVASVTVPGQGTRIISGNLWSQLEALTELLDEVNRPFTLKTTTSELVYPFPKPAVRELAVNALVHREYQFEIGIEIEIGRDFVRFTNPGGLIDEVAERARPTLQEKIESGVSGLKGYRNAVIADLLCGAGRMEKKGSGLPDVHRFVKRNGGRVTFGPLDDGNTAFQAVIFRRPEAVNRTTNTATPVSNRSRYYANLLEVVQVPGTVRSGLLKPDICIEDSIATLAPHTRHRNGQILTFAALAPDASALSALIQSQTIGEVETASFSAPGADSRDLVALLNICLYSALRCRSLIVDVDRKRAYFPRTTEGPRGIRYQASFRQATRTVARPFISRSTGRVLYWEHEAIWFGFERFASTWALRILPGYVFTVDGRETLLESRRVGALATRKAARDFNQQVLNDLVFWTWVFGGGRDSFEIATGCPVGISVLTGLSSCELEIPAEADLQFQPAEMREHAALEALEQEIAEEVEVELGNSECL